MLRFFAALSLVLAAALPVAAQDSAAPAARTQDPQVSPSALQERLDGIKADDSLPAELKTVLLDLYGRAVDGAKAADANAAAARSYAEAATSAPSRLAEIQRELDKLTEPAAPAATTSLADLEHELGQKQLEATTASSDAADREKEARRRAERRTAIPQLLIERRKQLDALPEQIADAPDVDPRVLTARRLVRLVDRARLQSEIETLTAEQASYDAEGELLRALRDRAERRATRAKAEVELWQAALQRARADSTREAVREQAAQLERTDSRLFELADGNARLAQTRNALADRIAAAERETATARADLDRLRIDFDEVAARVQIVGSTDAVGSLLRQRRNWLGEQSRSILQRARSRGTRIADAQLERFDIEERRQRMNRQLPREWLQQELGAERFDGLSPQLQAEAERLRKTRQDLLTALDRDYRHLLDGLTTVEALDRDVDERVVAYRAFLAERVLGIRSSLPVWRLDVRATGEALGWLGDAAAWIESATVLVGSVFGDVWPAAILLLLVALLALRPWLRRRLVRHGDFAMRGSNVSYLPTALALFDTVLLAIGLPGLLWFLAWRLTTCPDSSEFGKAVAAGIRSTATVLALVLLLRGLVRARGLGEAHFRWQTSTLRHLRRNLPLLLPTAFPLAFLLGALESRGNEAWTGSLGSLTLMATMTIALVVAWRTLHPVTGLVGAAMQGRPTALHRFRRVWFVLGVGTPLALLVMTALGYDYTAAQLARRLLATVAVVVLGVLVHALVLRGLVLERRRLQIKQAQERLAAARSADGSTPANEGPPLEEIDPQSLARQTQALLRGALTIGVLIAAYQIWVDVLPALGILRHVRLWADESNPAGVRWITLADVLLSLSVLVVAVVGARNLPALLELLVLQRFKMQTGERHAVATLARYGIVIVGVLLAFSTIGIGWSKVQWLVAAVSVGLGFGLQEIFANFVSGLILLFERPIRVGDIVTVGEVIGRVNRIRIRATTIQDWERKELVVPNREFVTGHFVNWTLSDSVVRWTIPVGVAYGTDTEKALALLAKIAADSAHVLRDPKPEAVFVRFGDSTLDLQLRVFVDMSALDYRWMTDLHQAIDRSFREAGIEIAFPQRDVNLKAAGPLLELLQRRPTAAPQTARAN